MAPVAAQTREQQLWSAEVTRVLTAASTLEPAVHRALRTTLRALIEDPAIDETMRADVVAMLSVINSATSVHKRNRLPRVAWRRHTDLPQAVTAA